MKLGRRSTTFAPVFRVGVVFMADFGGFNVIAFFSIGEAGGGGVVPVFDVADGLCLAGKAM